MPPGAPVALDVRLESVTEGVYVSGTAHARLEGECARCLDALTDEVTVTIGELFAYPDSVTDETTDEDELPRVVDEHVDLEQTVRDALVLDLPLAPLCAATAPACAPSAARSGPTSVPTTGMRHWIHVGPLCVSACPPNDPWSTTARRSIVAVPKRRMSRSNTRSRRSQWKATAPTLVACSNRACRATKPPHVACPTSRHLQRPPGRHPGLTAPGTMPERGAGARADRGPLLASLGVELADELLTLALTHRSYAYENGGLPTNERLEFLGDSVLSIVVTERLYRDHPDLPEGQLAKLRASVVNMHALAGVAASSSRTGSAPTCTSAAARS